MYAEKFCLKKYFALLLPDDVMNLGIPLSASKRFRFSDGEIGVSIEESVRGADIFVVQPTSEPANEHLIELFIMLDALKRASAYRINIVMMIMESLSI